jgi:succinate dehydrogenase / fumarate reductase cytochrome b subunit
MPKNDNRPIFLNLTRIRQPVTAIISISHRISGILLFIALPFVIYLLDRSLRSPAGYEWANDILHRGGVKLLAVLILWGLAHHLFAGLRHLLSDIGLGVELNEARLTAWLVAAGSVIVLLTLAGTVLW